MRLWLLIFFLMPTILLAADYYTVNNGATVDITEHSVCRRVTNSTGSAIFVPTKTSGEWSAFYGTSTSNVTKAACPVCTPGAVVYEVYGGDQTFTVPANCTAIEVRLWGAGGGGGTYPGGGGGFTKSTLTVTPGENLTVIVGSNGAEGGANCLPNSSTTYGGGGRSGSSSGGGNGPDNTTGGGRSAIRRGSTELLTAGGGGGGSGQGAGGAGGGTTGGAGGSTNGTGGGGGTQSAGGAGGSGSSNGQAGSQYFGGGGSSSCSAGGGGGYYGGGGGSTLSGGGGGSSYVTGTGGSTVAGSGTTPGGTADPYYTTTVGLGRDDEYGGPGRVLIKYGTSSFSCAGAGGFSYGGHCYFITSASQSCDAKCASVSGTCDVMGNVYAQSTTARCQAIIDTYTVNGAVQNYGYEAQVGCGFDTNNMWKYRYSAVSYTRCNKSGSQWRIACACH